MVMLLQQEQANISAECKSKKFWKYINKKTNYRPHISDLKWKDESGDDKIAVTDNEKTAALEEFSSVYTVEDDKDFEPLPSHITKTINQWMY